MAQKSKTVNSKRTAGQKNGSARKSSSATKTAGRSKTSAVRKENKRTAAKKKSFIKTEISSILLLAAGCFLLFTDLGLMGSVGHAVLSFQRGLFGQACYLFAVSLAAFAAVGYFERGKYLKNYKLLSVGAAFIAFTALVHLLFAERNADGTFAGHSFTEMYRLASEGAKGGGAVGGTIADTLNSVLGYAGSYLILIVLIIICAVIITEKSFMNAARSGAQRTAEAVKTGAGKTIEVARESRERRLRSQAERDLRKEEPANRKRPEDEAAAGRQSVPTLSGLTLGDADYTSTDAELFIQYGREIIGEGQPGIDGLKGVREPLIRKKHHSRQDILNTNFDTEVINSLPDEESMKPRPVNIKEINYDDDTVPFDETEEEKYRSYASMLNSSVINIETANKAGFAAGSRLREHPHPETGEFSFDAFKISDSANGNDLNEDHAINMIGFDDDRLISGDADSYAYATGQEEDYAAVSGYHGENTAHKDSDEIDPGSEAAGDPAEGDQIHDDRITGIKKAAEAYDDAEGAEDDYADVSADQDRHDAVFLPEKDKTYLTASGKEIESPDAYEAELIMAKKRGLSAGTQSEDISAGDDAGIPANDAKRVKTGFVKESAAEKNAEAIRHADQSKADKKAKPKPKPKPYVFPSINLLEKGKRGSAADRSEILNNAKKLEQVLRDFGVGATVTDVIRGPRVSRYEMIPDTGVKVSKITALQDDIKLALAATELRIEAPIPGKSAVGIEVPNTDNQTVRFRDILESEEFKNARSRLSWGIGLDIQGKPVIADIAKMPHVLVAGTTGSGKSVGINSLIMSILYRSSPDDVRMILVDPKVVELSVYKGIPHLLTDVVTKPDRAVSALNWAVAEMNKRYRLFQESATRNIAGYNEKIERMLKELPQGMYDEDEEAVPKKLPYILIVIDELSELMMHSKKDVESAIVSLTQLARAAGIHLVVATQRPSVDVITGLIKSNIPSRIAYRLPSGTDSRTILDSIGAETLLGNGDMLYKPGDKNSPARVQGAFLSDEEVEKVVSYIRKNNSEAADSEEFDEAINTQMELDFSQTAEAASAENDRDDYFAVCGRFIINEQNASVGSLQRKFKVGFNRAARIMDQLHEAGVVSSAEGTKKRQVLMSMEEFEAMLEAEGIDQA